MPTRSSASGPGVVRMSAATILAGFAAGAVGIALTLILHLVQHLAFGYTENTFLTGVERASSVRRVLAPTVGGVLVGVGWWLRRRWVDNERVSVTHALREDRPRLTVPATFADAMLQIVAVGVGASMGREGAPRQAAAAAAAWISERLAVTAAQQRTLLACGAGAGLASVYNVPLAGAVFTLEVLLKSLAPKHLIPAVTTAAISTVVAWPVLGDQPTYDVRTIHLAAPALVWVLLFAPPAGTVGVAFTRVMTSARSNAAGGLGSAAAIPVVFAALGATAIAFPQLLGNGKGMTELALAGDLALGLAGLLVLLKPLATAASLGAGAIGGLLTPALATGAVLGVFTGRLWAMLWPGANATQYAMLGAAILLAVTLKAPITAMLLTLELTGTGLALIAPMLVGVAIATLTARATEHRLSRRDRGPDRTVHSPDGDRPS